MVSFPVTVKEVLTLAGFKDAAVIAGHKGLDKQVKWVHMLETEERKQLFDDFAVMLSSMAVWQKNATNTLSLLERLVEAGVAGLCIDLENSQADVSEQFITFADKHDFPVITFNKAAHLLDIVHEINTILMKRQYEMLTELETFSKKLNHALLMPHAYKRVLNLLHQYLKVQVIYLPQNKDDTIFIPLQSEKEQHRLLQLIDIDKNKRVTNYNKQFHILEGYYAGQPIQALTHKFADLIIFPKHGKMSEYESLILDRCANAISQDLLRIFYIEEQRKHREKQWVYDWLQGNPDEEEVEQYLVKLDPDLQLNGVVACVCQFAPAWKDSLQSYYSAIYRKIFQNYGFYLISAFENQPLTFILINQRQRSDWKNRLKKAISYLPHLKPSREVAAEEMVIGIGTLAEKMEYLTESYVQAKEALHIQQRLKRNEAVFYEELHIFLLVSAINKNGNLTNYVQDYIGPVIDYDEAHNSELLHTLKVFLESNGSKKDAAKQLFIVRQTLYHRLNKLKELLGEDFMDPQKRTVIEFSVYAYSYLNPTFISSTVPVKPVP